MRKIKMQARSTTLSQKDLWAIMTKIEDYPKWCKFCKSMVITEFEEGAVFYDVTTLLWIPIKIEHVITKIKPYEELHFFLTLPRGGKMWHKFSFKQEGNIGYMTIEVTFDLGNKFKNATAGHVLEKRWLQLIHQGFPGLEEKKHIQ
jgi:hypothetical protein